MHLQEISSEDNKQEELSVWRGGSCFSSLLSFPHSLLSFPCFLLYFLFFPLFYFFLSMFPLSPLFPSVLPLSNAAEVQVRELQTWCLSCGPMGGWWSCDLCFVQSQTATRNAKTEIEILQRVDHVSEEPEIIQTTPLSWNANCLLVLCPCLLQPCLIKTEDFYQTDDSYYIVLELWVKANH